MTAHCHSQHFCPPSHPALSTHLSWPSLFFGDNKYTFLIVNMINFVILVGNSLGEFRENYFSRIPFRQRRWHNYLPGWGVGDDRFAHPD